MNLFSTDSTKYKSIISLNLDDKIYAIDTAQVEKVILAVEIQKLPKAPEIVRGIINFHGEIIPVIDTSKLFHTTQREININDKIIIAYTEKRKIALIADSVNGLFSYTEEELIVPDNIIKGIKFIKGIIKRENQIIMIYDLDTFIDFSECEDLIDNT